MGLSTNKKWIVVEIDAKGKAREITSSNTIQGAQESLVIHRSYAEEERRPVTFEIRPK